MQDSTMIDLLQRLSLKLDDTELHDKIKKSIDRLNISTQDITENFENQDIALSEELEKIKRLRTDNIALYNSLLNIKLKNTTFLLPLINQYTCTIKPHLQKKGMEPFYSFTNEVLLLKGSSNLTFCLSDLEFYKTMEDVGYNQYYIHLPIFKCVVKSIYYNRDTDIYYRPKNFRINFYFPSDSNNYSGYSIDINDYFKILENPVDKDLL